MQRPKEKLAPLAVNPRCHKRDRSYRYPRDYARHSTSKPLNRRLCAACVHKAMQSNLLPREAMLSEAPTVLTYDKPHGNSARGYRANNYLVLRLCVHRNRMDSSTHRHT